MDLHPSIAMRRSAPLVWLFASATLALVTAEPTHTLAQTQTECEPKRRSCIAECRAQYFSVDPKRSACIANCEAAANRCMRGGTTQRREDSRACAVPWCFPKQS